MSDAKHHDGPQEHERVWLLLPWHANGTLDAAERALVEEHLAGCLACREELSRCSGFAAALAAGQEAAPSPHPIQLARLMERIAASERGDGAHAGDDSDATDATDAADVSDDSAAAGEVRVSGAFPGSRGFHTLHGSHVPHGFPGADDSDNGEIAAGGGAGATTSAGEKPPGRSHDADLGDAAAREAVRGDGTGASPRGRQAAGRRDAALDARHANFGGSWRRGGRAGLLGATPVPVRWALAAQLAALLALTATLAQRPGGVAGSTGISGSAGPAGTAGVARRADYVTLSAPSPAAARPQIHLIFSETATGKEIRDVLLRTRGHLVDGPSPLGAYTLELPAPAAERAPSTARAQTSDRASGAARRGDDGGDGGPGGPSSRAGAPGEAAPDSPGIVLAYLRAQRTVRFAEPVAGAPWPAPAPAEGRSSIPPP